MKIYADMRPPKSVDRGPNEVKLNFRLTGKCFYKKSHNGIFFADDSLLSLHKCVALLSGNIRLSEVLIIREE